MQSRKVRCACPTQFKNFVPRQLLLRCSTSCIHAVVRGEFLINPQLFFQVMDVLPADCKRTVIHDVVL